MSVSIPAGRINKLFGTDGGVMLSLYADFPADFDTERRAQELLGLEFRIRYDEEDDDEFYMEDLIGFAVTGFEMRHGGTENNGNNSDNSGSNGSGNSGGNDDTCNGSSNSDGNNDTCNDDVSSNDNANANNGGGTPPAGQFAGWVADYYDSEANPLFELEIGGRRVLVPAAEEFIAHIDFEGRTMKMILPEGLIDL